MKTVLSLAPSPGSDSYARTGRKANANGAKVENLFLEFSAFWPTTCLVKNEPRQTREGRYIGKGFVDFIGTIGGFPVALELKHSANRPWRFQEATGKHGSNFPAHEREALVSARDAGMVALLILCETALTTQNWYYILPDDRGMVNRKEAVAFDLQDFPRIVKDLYRRFFGVLKPDCEVSP